MSVTITEKAIKSKIKSGERTIIIENIKHPHFESDKHKNLCKKMNSFYIGIAEKLSDHAKNKLLKKTKLKTSRYRLPVILRMNYTSVTCMDSIISVVLDLSFVNGEKGRERRFSQMWSIKDEDMLFTSEILRDERKCRKHILQFVTEKAHENAKNPAFGYFADYATKLSANFRTANFFIVPEGFCFFIDAGILSPAKYGASNFIIPFDEIKFVLKDDFLSKNIQNSAETSDIVNNI